MMWKPQRLALGRAWELVSPQNDQSGRVVIGYDAASIGWYVSARVAKGQEVATGAYQSYKRDQLGLDDCINWALRFLIRAKQPVISFDGDREKLLLQAQEMPQHNRRAALTPGTGPLIWPRPR